MSNLSVSEYLKNGGSINEPCHNFIDWFCSDASLKRRAIGLDKKVKILCDLGIINPDKNSVIYKNNCPVEGTLYDSILVTNLKNDAIYFIIPSSGHELYKGEASIYVYKSKETYEFPSWNVMKKELKTNFLMVA